MLEYDGKETVVILFLEGPPSETSHQKSKWTTLQFPPHQASCFGYSRDCRRASGDATVAECTSLTWD